MNQIPNNNVKKLIEPKVYGLILESPETVFLSVQCAYSLEEAFMLAKLEFEKQNSIGQGYMNPLIGAKIGLFTVKTFGELNAVSSLLKTSSVEHMMVEIVFPKPTLTEKEKNLLMREIIAKKDRALFQKNLRVFNQTEIKYLEDQLK